MQAWVPGNRRMQRWCWLIACGAGLVSVATGAAACGDDDDAEPRDAGRAQAGERDGAALPSVVVTPQQAVAGACLLKGTLGEEQFAKCKGLHQLEACARQQCELDLCVDQCTEYMTCLYQSPLSCDDTCYPQGGCAQCMSTIVECVFRGTCLETLQCAKQVSGGYCDQLRACCLEQGDLTDQCSLVAEATAVLQGEPNCRYFLDTIPSLSDNGVPCTIVDAGTPE